MVKALLFSFILFIAQEGFNQNLVPNSDFEAYVSCPYDYGQLDYATFWYNPTLASPDYFNGCDGTDWVGVPQNYLFGNQLAHSGVAYAGFGAVYDSTYLNYREYLQVELTGNLVVGKKYVVSFFFAKADSASLGLKNFGVAITDIAIGGSFTTQIPTIPQITYDNFALDNSNWIEFKDTITALGSEQFLTIGYFNENNFSDTLSTAYSEFNKYAYYYIDDVSVVEISDVSTNANEEQNKIQINQSNGMLNLQSNCPEELSIEIFAMSGEKIIVANLQPNESYIIDMSMFTGKNVIIRVFNSKTNFTKKIYL